MFNKRLTAIILSIIMLFSNILSVYAAEYTYDALGRLVSVEYDDDTEKTATYTYDAGGNITNVSGFDAGNTIGSYVWNCTDGTNTNSFYTVNANEWNNPATIDYNGLSLTKAVKMESSSLLSFNALSAGTLKVVTYSTNASPIILLNNVQKSVAISGETDIEISAAGTYNITKGTTNTFIYYMEFIPEGIIIDTTETTTETTTEYIDHSLNYTWDFDSNMLKTLGTISEIKTVDELTFIAGTGKTMEVELNSKQLNGITHKYTLNTGGAGSKTGRAVSFAVNQNTNIYITVKSVNSTPCTLTLENGSGIVGTSSIDDTLDVQKFTYTGADDTLYIYSANGAIQIYSIAIRSYSGDEEDIDTTWNFSSTEFSNIGAVSATQEIRGLSVYSGCELITDAYLLNETRYTKSLNLPERGSNESESVSFYVTKNADIYITAQASNSTRELLLVNEFGSVIDSAALTTTPKTYHLNYTGNGDKLYIRSGSSAIRIFDISVKTENNMQPLNKTWKFNNCVENDVLDDDISGLSLTGAVTLMTEPTANSSRVYAQSLNLAETGTSQSNNIKLVVPTDTALKVTVSSYDDTSRQVFVTNQYGYVLGSMAATAEPTELSMTSTCDNEIICIRSLNGSVHIQEITVGTGSGIEDGIVEQKKDIDSSAASTETINNLMLDNYESEYKSQLSSTEKSIYELFVQKFASDNPAIDKIVKIAYENAEAEYTSTNTEELRKSVRNAFSAFVNDYPEVFWIDTFALTFVSNGSNIYETDIWVLRYDSFVDDSAVTNAISQLNTALSSFEIVYNNGTFRFEASSADGYDRVKFIYLYIMDNVNYTSASTAENRHNVYGALVLKNAESDGIARAFKLLCKKCNISAVYACGKINNSIGNAYAWNYVNVFDAWYMCDITTDIVNEAAYPEYSMSAASSGYVKGNPSVYKAYDGITFAYPYVESYDCFIWGDANLRGVLDSEDAKYVLAMTMNASFTSAKRSFINADVSGDGIIDASDAARIWQKYINPDWEEGDPIDDSIRDMFGINGVAVYNENMAALDMNNDNIVNVDDWVIGVNSILAENSEISTYSSRQTNVRTVTREMILDLFD